MRTHFDAVIIGAGPAGSSMAILLARAGWAVALVEKESFPRRKVCGECIAASNFPLLEALGIGPALAASAGPELRRVAFLCGGRALTADLPTADHSSYRWGRAIGREMLDTFLLAQASAVGATVLQPWAVWAISGAAGAWRVDISNGEHGATRTLTAPIAIAANGSWEPLPSDRPLLGTSHHASDLLAFKANFSGAALEPGVLPVLAIRGGYGGMVVADNATLTLACCIRRDQLAALRRTSPGVRAGDVVEAMLLHDCGGVRTALRDATRVGPWLAAGPLRPGIRVDSHDGIFRIGNAAGEAHPIIGEGMSMALQSAWLLSALLLTRPSHAGLANLTWQRDIAARYAAQWRQQFAPRLRLAKIFAQLAMRPSAASAILWIARCWPGLLTLGAKLSGKTRSAIEPDAIGMMPAPLPASTALGSH